MSTFTLLEQHSIPGIQSELYTYRHSNGLIHYHLANKDSHYAASLGLRTVPYDNSGIAHVLEHSALCGSKRYPVRDPFFMMLRRSMQTFMNAMTSDDCTWYPFSTKNQQDFFNLLGVYSDAVFNPRLHELDIAQEGHRWAMTENGPELAGIVYNEMKGAYDDIDHVLYRALVKNILPDTIYRHESGGDPIDIPDLTIEAIKRFHKQYYQPSNACLSTYGDLNLNRIHDELEAYLPQENAASENEEATYIQAPRYAHRRIITETPCEEETKAEEHIISAWLFGDSSDPIEYCKGMVCESLFIGHAGSPLRHALESSKLCQSIDGSGYLAYCRNGILSFEAHACKKQHQEDLASLILNNVTKTLSHGFQKNDIEDAIKQQEMQDRYISGDRTPFGLQLCESVIDAWTHHQKPHHSLDTDAIYRDIWKQYNLNQRIFDDYANHHILEEAQHLEVFSENTLDYAERYHNKELQRKKAVSEDDIETIKQLDNDLQKRRDQIDDESILPKVQLSDISKHIDIPTYSSPIIHCPSNGISYLNYMVPVKDLRSSDIHLLHVLNKCFGSLGDQHNDYQVIGSIFHKHFGSHSVSLEQWFKGDTAHLAMSIEAWGLSHSLKDMHRCLDQHIKALEFTEVDRFTEILQQEHQQIKDRVIQSPQQYAVYESIAQCHPFGAFNNQHRGLPYFNKLQTYSQNPEALISSISALHQRCQWDKSGIYIYQDEDSAEALSISRESQTVNQLACPEQTPPNTQRFTAFNLASSVQYVACAVPAPEWTHPDAAILCVIGNILQNVYLHKAIREQGGAYGASAYYHAAYQSFVCGSYRDPHLDQTINSILQSFESIKTNTLNQQQLEEAIISAIAEIDRPASPFTEAKRCMLRHLRGEQKNEIELFRKRILSCTPEDIHRCALQYLCPEHIQTTCFGNEKRFTESQFNWQMKDLFKD